MQWLSTVTVTVKKGMMSLTYDRDLLDFIKSTLDVLDVRQTLVQI